MDSNERERSAIVEKLLMLGQPLSRICRVFALLLLGWLLDVRIHGPFTLAHSAVAVLAAATRSYSEWRSTRICLDQRIFGEVADGKLDFAQLDQALSRTARSFDGRRTGARALPGTSPWRCCNRAVRGIFSRTYELFLSDYPTPFWRSASAKRKVNRLNGRPRSACSKSTLSGRPFHGAIGAHPQPP